MVSIKDRKILRQMFSHYDYVMTTAQLSKEKLYYRDIQRMLKAGLIEKVKRGYLNLLPMKWSYTVAKASKKAVASEWNISEASLPMSVKIPTTSLYGIVKRWLR